MRANITEETVYRYDDQQASSKSQHGPRSPTYELCPTTEALTILHGFTRPQPPRPQLAELTAD